MLYRGQHATTATTRPIKKADTYLKASQWGEPGLDKSDPRYGGGGYGKHKRPDLSNTSFLIDALKAAGNGPDDEAMKRALVFVSRCQNLETENNTTPFAAEEPRRRLLLHPGGRAARASPARRPTAGCGATAR